MIVLGGNKEQLIFLCLCVSVWNCIFTSVIINVFLLLFWGCIFSNRLRELTVDLRPPEFISSLSSALPRNAKDIVANILKG